MTFSYKAYDDKGVSVRGRLEAADAREASRQLLAKGLYVRTLAAEKVRRGGLNDGVRSALYQELSALIGAGLPLDRALSLLSDERPDAAAALSAVLAGVREGQGLADSLERAGAGLSSFERAAIASAERSATLPAMLTRLADHLEASEKIRSDIRSALVYPCFVLALGALVAAVMLGYIAPLTTKTLLDAGIELPASSQMLVKGAKAVVFVILPIVVALLAAFGAARWRASRDERFAIRLDRFLLDLPWAGPARLLASQRFADLLGTLVESGLTVPGALPLAGAGTGHPFLASSIAAATDRIRAGTAPFEALSSVPYVGALLSQWLRVGEAGGCLPQMLSVAARRLRAQWSHALSVKLSMVGPVLLALVGAFVLVLSLALILPVVQLSTRI